MKNSIEKILIHKITVDILIPCYNGQKYIDKCLEHLVKQTYPQDLIHIYIINDGSKDNSLNILQEWQAKYPLTITVVNQENVGIFITRERLINLAKADYIIWNDVDDYYEYDAIYNFVKKCKHGKIDVICSRTMRIQKNGKKKIWWITSHTHFNPTPLKYLQHNTPFLWATMYKLSFIKQLPIFNYKIKLFEDMIQKIFIFSRAKTIACLHKVTYNYLDSETSISSLATINKELNHQKFVETFKSFDIVCSILANDHHINQILSTKIRNAIRREILYEIGIYIVSIFFVINRKWWQMMWNYKMPEQYAKEWTAMRNGYLFLLKKYNLKMTCPRHTWWKWYSYLAVVKKRYKKGTPIEYN